MNGEKRYINKTKFLYAVIRVSVFILLVANIVAFVIDEDDSQRSRAMFNAAQSLMMFLCTYVPGFIEKKGKVSIPNVMSVVFILFCLSHFVVGEIGKIYVKSKTFDSILHALSGSMLGILGFSVIRLLNDSERIDLKLSPLFVSLIVVCFAVTVGVVWEVLEFAIDALTGSNMQRYSDSVTREPFLGKEALFDTMKDLILDTGGAIIVSVISYVDLRNEKGHSTIKWFIEKRKESCKDSSNVMINVDDLGDVEKINELVE